MSNIHNGNRQIANGTSAFEATSRINENQQQNYLSFTLPQNPDSKVMSAPHISAQVRGGPGSNQMPAPFYPSRGANLMSQRPTLDAVSIVQHNSSAPHTVPEYTVVVNSQFPPTHSTSVGQNISFNPNNPMQARSDNIYHPSSFVPAGAPFIYPQIINPYYGQPTPQWVSATPAASLNAQYIQTMPYSQLLPPNAMRVPTSNMVAGGSAPVSASQAAVVSHMPPLYGGGAATVQQQAPRRERHVLAIIDPTTNKNILENESNVVAPAVTPAVTDQPPFGKPPSQYAHDQHGHGHALASTHSRQTTTPPTHGATQASGRATKDTTSGNDRPRPSHSPAIGTQSQENVAQMENAYSELSLAIAQVTDKKDDQKVTAAHPKPLPHSENVPPAPAAVKRFEKGPPPPQQVAPAAAAPPITFGFFDDSGVGAGSDEVSSPSPPDVSPEKTTQPQTAVPAGSGVQAAVAVELTNTTKIISDARRVIIHTTEQISSTTTVATVAALEKKDTGSAENREIAEIEKAAVEKSPVKDPQAEILGELKNKKATNAWFYDNLEGNRVYASEYMFLLLKLPLSCQKPLFSNHLPDVIMSDWENRAEQSFQRRGVGVSTPNVQSNFAGRSSATGAGPMLNFQVSWQAQQATTMPRRTMAGYGGRGSQGGSGGGGGASIGGRGSQDGRDRRAGPRSSQQGQQPPMIIPRPSLNAEVQLNRTEHAWKPIRQQNTGADPEVLKTKELFRDVKVLLNKITPQTFEDLSTDFFDLWTKVDTVDRADGVIEILFRKVCDEPTFAELYARLCSGLRAHQTTNPPPQDCGINTFNFQLLMKCQKDFEKEKSTEDYREELMQEIANTPSDAEKKKLKDNLEEKVNKYKWRTLGSIRFVGELYKFGLLTQYLAHICVHRLINKAQQFDEEVTQCLCQLLTNIGGKLENEKADVKNRVSSDYVKKYFEMLKSLQKDSKFCKRIQFEILNLIELREVYHWEPRRQKEGPKKLEEVHADIEREKMAKSTELDNMGPPMQPPSRKGSQYQSYGQQSKGSQEFYNQGQQQRRDLYQSGGRTSHHGSYASNLYAQGDDDAPMQGGTLNRRKPSQQMSGGGRSSQGGRSSISNRGGQGPQSQQQFSHQGSSQGQDRAPKSEALKMNTDLLKPQSKSWSTKASQQSTNPLTTLQNRFAVFDDQSKNAGSVGGSRIGGRSKEDLSAPGSRESSRAPSDRIAALEAVSSLSRQSSSGGGSGARFETPAPTAGSATSSSREPSVVRDVAAVSTAAEEMSGEKLKRHAVQLFAEYVSSNEYTEAKELIVEHRSRFTDMVPYILEYVVEKKDEDRLKFAHLMSKLYNDSVVDKQILTDGFAKFVELCIDCDLVGDVPLLWDYLAAIIAEMSKSSSSRSLRLGDFYSSFKAADHYKYKLFTKCLQKLSHLPVDKQKSAYGDFFTSGANYWSIFDFADRSALIDDLKDKTISLPEFPPVPPQNNPNDNTTNNSIVNSSNNELIAKALQDTVLVEMERLIKSMNPVDGDLLIQYIVENVKNQTLSEDYAHALARYLCSNVFKMMHSDGESREIEELFGPCLPVFTRFFTGNKPLEKILLTTLSEVYYENQCPKDSLTTIFELLSMENTLPRDAFLDWWSLEQQRNTYGMILRNSKLKTFVENLQRVEGSGAGQTSSSATVAAETSAAGGAWSTPKSQNLSTKTKKK